MLNRHFEGKHYKSIQQQKLTNIIVQEGDEFEKEEAESPSKKKKDPNKVNIKEGGDWDAAIKPLFVPKVTQTQS